MPEDNIRWLTYREMAKALHLPSEKAALSRSRRERWPRQINNERGLALVGVPLSVIKAAANRPPSRNPPEISLGNPPETGQDPPARTLPDDLEAELRRRAEAAEAQLREVVSELAEQRERAARAEGEATALRGHLAREAARAEREAADRRIAEAQRHAVQAARDAAQAERDAAQGELAKWTAGGPVARAWRAFLSRRGRP